MKLSQEKFPYVRKISTRCSRKITWLMYISSCIIVLWHSTGYKNFTVDISNPIDRLVTQVIDGSSKMLFSFVMPVFFLMSAFLMYRNLRYSNMWNKIKKRFRSVLIPYLVWNTLWMAFLMGVELFPGITANIDSLQRFEFSIKNIVEGIFLYKYNTVYWYMLNLLIFIMLAPLLFTALKSKVMGVIVIAVAVWAEAVQWFDVLVWLRGESIVFYLIGAYVGMHWPDLLEKGFQNRNISGIAGILLAAGTMYIYILTENHLLKILLPMLTFIGIWMILDIPELLKIRWWMQLYFFIYSFHRITQQCVNKLIGLILPDRIELAFLNWIGGAVITLFISIAVARLLIAYVPWGWKVLNGYRKITM